LGVSKCGGGLREEEDDDEEDDDSLLNREEFSFNPDIVVHEQACPKLCLESNQALFLYRALGAESQLLWNYKNSLLAGQRDFCVMMV